MSPPPSISNILGPASIGIILSSIVFGINCLQMYLYYTQYSTGDGSFLKTYVAVLMLVDSIHVILLVMSYYHYTVTCFGDYIALAIGYRPLVAEVLVGSIIIAMVQHFYAFRVYVLCGKRVTVLPFIISLLSISQLALSIAFTVIGIQVHIFILADRLTPYTEAGLTCDLVCDAVIAATIIYYLRARRTVFPRTNRAIKLLITYALNTCFLTTVLSFVDLIMIPLFSETMIYSVLYFILVRLYTCTLLSTLNSRDNVRQALEGHDLINFPQVRVGAPHAEVESGSSADVAMKWASPSGTQKELAQSCV